MSVFSKILRAGEGKKVRALSALVPEIGALEPEMEALSDADLQHKTVEFREQLERAGSEGRADAMNDLLVESFAVTREAARRTLGQRHFDVQLMGGAALHFGWIAEMKTGEGKTLTSALPLYLNGLTGRGCHLVTVNDYLAGYHAELMGRLYSWLGLTVGLVGPQTEEPTAKKAAYAADITYGTNTEFGFDYLRDNMAYTRDRMAQRGFVYGIIDEVDSILIDEARTPLIISGPAMESAKLYQQFSAVVRSLKRDADYEVDEEKRTVAPSEEGIERVEKMLGVDNLYDLVSQNLVHQLTQALRAKELYKRDKDYIVADGEVKIVDEFTGRILDGRRWSDGLHQAVEAKERVRIKEENHTWATITLQNYFRQYEKLSGMTGTAETEASEFANTYNLPVVPIPTHKPMIRGDEPDLIYKSELSKFTAAIEDIKQRHDAGQPVLVGTASVEKSEVLGAMLHKEGIPHTVLNAKQHSKEALVIAQAGRLHAVTVATNMAGRGVDIVLGGNAELLAEQEVQSQGLDLESEEGQAARGRLKEKFDEECTAAGKKIVELGGLYVLGSERHESRRIDNQLRGRSGRQGDPGESRFFLSLEDELMRLFATGAMSWVMSRALPDDEAIEAKMVTKAIEKAQNTVETRNAEIRKDVLKYDEVMNEQRKVIYAKRMRVIDGEDLRQHLLEVLDSALSDVVESYCPDDSEDWNLEGLLAETKLYYPSKFTVEDLAEAVGPGQIHESLLADAVDYYTKREASVEGGAETMREVERQVMLQLIDQKWREHLSEMDYLREGIGLRAMGQQDPLVAWQKEGYSMFGVLVSSIDDDFVKYAMHVDVQVEKHEELDLSQASLEGPAEPVQSLGGSEAAVREAAQVAHDAQEHGVQENGVQEHGVQEQVAPAAAVATEDQEARQPKVKAEHERVGRNELCWCGSGKKYKHCHGR